MRVRGAADLLLLVAILILRLSQAERTNDKRNQDSEVRPRRHESEERTSSGRRWTTSVNSPYQKIVSSFEQGEPEPREAASEQTEDADQAKAKSHKRKQPRTSAPSHDQIPSETSSDSQKAVAGSNAPNTTDPDVPEAPRSQKPPASSSRRRGSSHREQTTTTEAIADVTTSNPKKRRRPTTPASTTTTLAPQTMSDSLYQYFRPLDQDVPQDDIIPFLDFGRKLSPVLPTPSGANSIENRSRITKLRPRGHHEERESNSSDEEILQEDMDVTVVKKAIERNSVPRGKLRVREQGISDYYRKRVPTQVRTTENLISTSDSSTASSVPGSKNIGVLKKLNRHQIHPMKPLKVQEHVSEKISPEVENFHDSKNVEVLQNKRRQTTPRTNQRSAALKQEAHHSPLTAESTLVKTVIKEFPTGGNPEREARNTTKISTSPNTTIAEETKRLNSSFELEENKTNATKTNQSSSSNQDEHNPKILSTAVVTSVSVQESLQESQHHPVTVPPKEATDNSGSANSTTTLNPPIETTKNTSLSRPSSKSYISIRNSTNTIKPNATEPVANKNISSEPKTTTAKNETPLRSREIYRPKGIPPGSSIPHLPRQIPFSPSHGNASPKTASPLESTTKPTTLFRTSAKPSSLNSTSLSTIPTPPEESTFSTRSASPSTIARNTATTKIPEMISQNPSTSTVTVPQELSENDKAKDGVIQPNISHHVHLTTSEVLSSKEIENSTKPSTGDVEDQPDLRNHHPTNHKHDVIPLSFDEQSRGVEEQSFTESDVLSRTNTNEDSTDNLTFVPVYPSETDSDDLFPIYFTTTAPPVVDTRPETETAVVEEQKNATTPRPGAEWLNVGAGDKEVEVVYPEPLGAAAYVLAALGVVPILVGALIGARFIMVHNKKKVLDESEYSSEYNRSPLGVSSVTPLPTKLPRIPTHVSWSETEKSAPTISPVTSATSSSASGGSVGVRWEFPREKLRLQTVLGQGNFGQVWKAEADDISGHEGLTRLVAVKTVKETANLREREDLLRELGIMQELGSHPNVVTLLGCCTEKEPIYLIMEYVMYGKLLSFLRDHRTRAHYYNFSDATDALTSRDLTVFAYCVARGMDYLSNKSIIHRDLAARNVLVDHNKLCKIADFGMSRNVRDTGQIYEQRQSKGALPIRWMAPESLHFSLFTHKTDVWSFGILMWEIVTLGSTPYARMGAREVMRRVRDGYRLDRPSHCRPELFRVIAQCWHSEPSKRPSFAELKAELAQLLSDSELNGSYVDLDSFADEMRRDTLHRHH